MIWFLIILSIFFALFGVAFALMILGMVQRLSIQFQGLHTEVHDLANAHSELRGKWAKFEAHVVATNKLLQSTTMSWNKAIPTWGERIEDLNWKLGEVLLNHTTVHNDIRTLDKRVNAALEKGFEVDE